MGVYLLLCNWLPFYGYVKNLKSCCFKTGQYFVFTSLGERKIKKKSEQKREKGRRSGECLVE